MNTLARISMKLGSGLKALSFVALIAGLFLSPISEALEIRLGTAMNVRELDEGGLDTVGTLTKGSVVEIPDRFKIVNPKTGKVDAEATFNNWLRKAGYSHADVNRKIKNPRKDYVFPVRIVSAAKGSTAKGLIGKTRFMALRVLERSPHGLIVKKTSRVYSGPKSAKPLPSTAKATAKSAPAPRAAPIAQPPRPKKPKPVIVVAPVPAPQADDSAAPPAPAPAPPADTTAPDAETSAPPATTETPAPAPSEAGTGSGCADCDAARYRQSTDPRAEDLGTNITMKTLPGVYNAEASGLQGPTSSFPPSCSGKFINDDGTYGPYGQSVLKEIAAFPDTFLNAKGMTAVCPNFKKPEFNEAEKRHFWVWLMESIAAQESTCSTTVDSTDRYIGKGKHRVRFNPNGIASGLYQIEKNPNLREGRDRLYGGRFCAGNPHDLQVNTRCAVRMLEDIVDNGKGPYSMENHYWSVLIKNGTLTHKLINQYSACGAKASSTGKKKTSRRSRK